MTEPCTQKDRIKEIRDDVKTVLNVLQGSDANGGLVTRVSNHGKYFKIIAAVGLLALGGRIAWRYFFPS
jgi:hypothetical protein